MLTSYDFISAVEQEIKMFKKNFSPETATDLMFTKPDGKRVGFIDVVIEGGGVKGIGAIGALYALEECDLRFRKIAGTSAGALNAAFLACAGRSAADHKTALLLDILANIDFLGFADGGDDARAVVKLLTLPESESALETMLTRAKITVAAARNMNEVMLRLGLNPGGRLKAFLCHEFEKLNGGAEFTVGSLRRKWRVDAIVVGGEPLEQDFQVVASDISRRQKAVFPLDLEDYVRDGNSILIGDLVRASASIPMFFAPFRLGDFSTPPENIKAPASTCFVDGFIVSNFPLSLFDVSDFAAPPRCPTFGITIEDNSKEHEQEHEIDNLVKLSLAIFQTASQHGDKGYIKHHPSNATRIIHVSNKVGADNYVSAIDFTLTDDDKIQLFRNGVLATLDKLSTWNFRDYVRRYRGA
jgi:NTE family protein